MKTLCTLVLASLVCASFSAQAQPLSWLSNLSFRADLDPNKPTIIGFAVDGDPGTTMDVFIRAVGPGLAQFGVENTHPNPKLEVYAPTGDLLAWNDQWDKDVVPDPSGRVHPILLAEFRSGAFSLVRGSKDAAIFMTLGPGMQTVHIKPADGVSRGVVHFEIYSLTRGSPPPIRLSNLSVLTTVGPDKTVIVGLSMRHTQSNDMQGRWILTRAVGPQLEQFGVSNPHPNPLIDVYNLNGMKLTTIGRWEMSLPSGQSGAPSRERYYRAQSSTGAFPLPTGSMDAAALLDLSPFSWTFHLKSGNGATGEVLFELYDVPQSAW